MLFKFLVIFNLIIGFVISNRISSNRLHSLNLNHENIKLSWLIDWKGEEVLFNVQNVFTEEYKWFYFGFSKRGDFEESDLCFFQINSGVFGVVTDTFTSDDGKYINKDSQQDCKIIRIEENSVAFRRKFDTCDPLDLTMHEGTMYLLWARGTDEFDFSNYETIKKPKTLKQDEGMHMLQLLRADIITIPETDFETFEIHLDKVDVPAQDTTYWCKIQKLHENITEQKYHIIQFEPILENEDLVHHMEVFHCNTEANVEIPMYNGDCDNLPEQAKVCSKVISLWAMGASIFTYPIETGLPIGGKDYNPYIRLEVHFNNPEIVGGRIDSSGMRIKYVSKLREFDAAVMELGLEYTDKMAIPPGQIGFPLSGYCIAECTEIALHKNGISIFGSQLHTHLRGKRVLTRHFRNGIELPEINRDDYYSHHYQEIRQLRKKPVVLPGDALVTTCYYDTIGYKNTTLGGFSISDEMCVNYIHYYPATDLEVCKSSVSEQTLSDYFVYIKEREHQKKVDPKNGRSTNYQAIKWTETRVDELYTMYVQEPLSMQCNKSDGNRFEGFNWEGAPITPVKIQIPKKRSDCGDGNFDPVKSLEDGQCDLLGECIY